VIPSTEQAAKDLDGETVENGSESQDPSTVTDEEYDAMQSILLNIYAYRAEDGDDPSKLFHRKVNRRVLPDYYDVIKEPMAMSVIKAKINTREYKTFEEFVRDFALICHNAQVYNAPNARAYQDALTIKSVLEEELAQLVKKGIVTKERTTLPFLGEIPPADETVVDDGEEDDEDDDEDDEEEDDDSDDEGKKRRRRGRPSLAKREGRADGKDKEEDPESRKKRGRPPRVDTPMESRIKAVIKGLRKFKNSKGQLMVISFERMPDKAVMPEYFSEIKQPMALDLIKKKLKRKKYTTVDQFMVDIELMFDNAKQYNKDESQIYKDAVELQKEARVIVAQEKSKPDSEFVMEDGRIPLPEGILHNGELWKVGTLISFLSITSLSWQGTGLIFKTPTT
jgi:chromatin structure-remodeling complex subunit RSC1/2